MEDEALPGQAAEAEAPPGDQPGDALNVTAQATFEADHASELASDFSNIDALIEQARAAALAEAGEDAGETAAAPARPEAAPTPEPAQAETPPSTEKPAEPDYAAILADLAAKGYKVEAPPPPADPYETLVKELADELGTDEAYAETRRKALQFVPAEPASYDAESVARHEALVRERNEAAATLQRFDSARRLHARALAYARNRALADVGQAFSALPETYQLSPERARRVTEPQSATDAVAAVVEQVTERLEAAHAAKLAERERYWQGEVARARADRAASAVQQLGRAPQPASAPGGRPAGADPFAGLFDTRGGVSDDVIERAKRGELANLVLE